MLTPARPRERGIAGHIVHSYLPRSEVFIHTQLRFQVEFEPVVLARFEQHLDEFPFERLVRLIPPRTRARRIARRARCVRRGYSRHAYAYELEQAARSLPCDVLHAHFGWAGWEAAHVVARLGVPLVTTFYGLDLVDTHGLDYRPLFSGGSLFLVEGPVMAARLEAIGCPADKIRIVRIGIDLAHFEFVRRKRTEPLILLQTARMVDKKGFDLTIRAFGAARGSLGPAELWLVGDGPLRSELEDLVAKLGLASCVRFHGTLSHAAYREVARRAHIGLQPSRTAADGDTEGGAPTVLLEMQAAGLPIIASSHADIPFVVPDPERLPAEEDVQGIAASIVELASISDAEYHELAERSRSFVAENHDAAVVAPSIAEAYREAIRDGRGSGVEVEERAKNPRLIGMSRNGSPS